MDAKAEMEEYFKNSLANKLMASRVPQACKQNTCILGIDEAGRGPVLGPMSYSIAYYPRKSEGTLNKMKFADSKQLTEAKREQLFEALLAGHGDYRDLGYVIKIIAPNMISNSMLRRKKYNLNALSHDTAIDLIRAVESKGVKIDHVYIDTVGTASAYRDKLKSFFPRYEFTVTDKADSKFAIVSAASVCAKVMRDRIISNWIFAESSSLRLDTFDIGSGYPGDAVTKKYLEDSMDPVFGFPTLARFSWSTIPKLLQKGACKCDWNEPLDEDQNPKQLNKQQNMMKNFFFQRKTTGPASSPRTLSKTTAELFFTDRSLTRIVVWK